MGEGGGVHITMRIPRTVARGSVPLDSGSNCYRRFRAMSDGWNGEEAILMRNDNDKFEQTLFVVLEV